MTDSLTPRSRPDFPVYRMEDHHEALTLWQNARIKNATLVHIDAHIDYNWYNPHHPDDLLNAESMAELEHLIDSVTVWNPTPKQDLTADIGNYINYAILEGIVNTFYWIVPDDFMNSATKIRTCKKKLSSFAAKGKHHKIQVHENIIRTQFGTCMVLMTTLQYLPHIDGTILLDIDTDFLVTDYRAAESVFFIQAEKRLPWIWPEKFHSILTEKKITPAMVTIAYSVQGYFTPIEYKFLGDELFHLFSNSYSKEIRMAYQCLHRGLIKKADGRWDDAIKEFKESCTTPSSLSPACYNLSSLYYYHGNSDKAAKFYKKAIDHDQGYRTPFNNAGELYRSLGLTGHMEREYRRLLTIDPDNPVGHAGMAEVFFIRGDYALAKAESKKTLQLDPCNGIVKSLLSKLLFAEGSMEEPLSYLEEITASGDASPSDFLLYAHILKKTRRFDDAMRVYKNILNAGFCSVGLYLDLGYLYMRRGNTMKGIKNWKHAVTLLPHKVLHLLQSTANRVLLSYQIARLN